MDPYIGEIRIFAGNYAPRGWQFCNGQMMQIAQQPALFSVLGNTYGGDGSTTFALPNLQGQCAIGAGQGAGLSPRALGQNGGVAAVTLSAAQLASHGHNVSCGAAATQTTANASSLWANGAGSGRGATALYGPAPDGNTKMSPAAVLASGGGLPHDNVQPSLTLSFIIAVEGLYPSPD